MKMSEKLGAVVEVVSTLVLAMGVDANGPTPGCQCSVCILKAETLDVTIRYLSGQETGLVEAIERSKTLPTMAEQQRALRDFFHKAADPATVAETIARTAAVYGVPVKPREEEQVPDGVLLN